jgi:cytochrome P450
MREASSPLNASKPISSRHDDRLRPPAPIPRRKPLGTIDLLKALRDNPLEAWDESYFEKPIVTTKVIVGRVAMINDPAAIKHVLVDNTANYRKDTLQRRILSAGMGGGLLTAEADQWRMQRRTLAPIFSGKTVIGFTSIMAEEADNLVEQWHRRNTPLVDLADEATCVAIRVLERTIFSDGLGRDPHEVRRAMSVYFNTIGRIDPIDILGLPDFVPRPTRIRVAPTLRYFDAAIDEIIERRRRRLATEPDRVRPDVLTLLLNAQDPVTGKGMSEAEIRGNILTFIAAGQETTANAIAWSTYLISRSPEWRRRIRREASAATDCPVEERFEKLIETRAAVEEAMRLYPPIATISRTAVGPDELAGHPIAPGTLVVIAPYVLHRHRKLWSQPDIFDPTRFLPENREQIDRYSYLPFGIGPRTCIGAAFALREATIIVASIIKNFDLEPTNHTVWPVHKVTLRPRDGLPMIIQPIDEKQVPLQPQGTESAGLAKENFQASTMASDS